MKNLDLRRRAARRRRSPFVLLREVLRPREGPDALAGGTALGQPSLPALLGSAGDAEAMALALRRAGITHVLVSARELERTASDYRLSNPPPARLRRFPAFLEQRGELLLRGNGVFLDRAATDTAAAPAAARGIPGAP